MRSQNTTQFDLKAIAAMSTNRVIGIGGKIPWHLSEDFKWFKATTLGKVVLMGRRTYESIGKPLPNRINLVLTRNPQKLTSDASRASLYAHAKIGPAAVSAVRGERQRTFAALEPTQLALVSELSVLTPAKFDGAEVFVIGGAMTYEATRSRWSDLFLTLVKREILNGDAFFPPFEEQFELVEELRDTPEFKILHFRNRSLLS
jgi:dihydrofolate reductase